MGDPKKQRRKFTKPTHPWQRTRLEEEKVLKEEFGLKNKKEFWKMNSVLGKFKAQTKSLIRRRGSQADKEKTLFLDKLSRLKLIPTEAAIEDVLNLTINDILERRLQTILYRKGFAKTIKQARQFITHGHVIVNDKKVNIPSYLLSAAEEDTITFSNFSALADAEHPERKVVEKKVEKIEEETPTKEAQSVEKEKPTEEVKEAKNAKTN
tara:strand:- start:300 stop:926 length:627 start_codon:yes stop_codon:yes gene_type:complete